MHASRGRRELADGSVVPLEDPSLAASLRAVARSVWLRALVAAALTTAVLLILPVRGS